MRSNYQEILANAEMEVEYLEDYVLELSSIEDTRKLRRAWSGILDHYVKAVAALRRATDSGKSKNWSDKLFNQQKRDPILKYAYEFRNHEAHVFDGKRDTHPRSVNVGDFISITSGKVLLSHNVISTPNGASWSLPNGVFEAKDGRYVGGTIPRVLVQEREHYIILTPLVTRSGKLCVVPNQETASEKQAIEIAQYVANWVKAKLVEAKELAAAEKRR